MTLLSSPQVEAVDRVLTDGVLDRATLGVGGALVGIARWQVDQAMQDAQHLVYPEPTSRQITTPSERSWERRLLTGLAPALCCRGEVASELVVLYGMPDDLECVGQAHRLLAGHWGRMAPFLVPRRKKAQQDRWMALGLATLLNASSEAQGRYRRSSPTPDEVLADRVDQARRHALGLI